MATSKQAVKTGPSRQLSDAEITSLYNEQKSELQMLAQKIGELETEADEHALVMESITPLDPSRKCFRLVGGVLVERTVKEVLPALKTNHEGIKSVINQLLTQYKKKEDDFKSFQQEHKIQVVSR